MTLTERTVCSAHTGHLFFDGDEWIDPIMKYAYRILNEPISIHDLESPEFWDRLQVYSVPDFTKIYRGEDLDFTLEREDGDTL